MTDLVLPAPAAVVKTDDNATVLVKVAGLDRPSIHLFIITCNMNACHCGSTKYHLTAGFISNLTAYFNFSHRIDWS